MQMLHPFAGSIQQYSAAIADPDRYRPDHCPQCEANQPLAGHGFYQRTLVDVVFDGVIRVRRYLCRLCKRTVSLSSFVAQVSGNGRFWVPVDSD